MLCLRPMGCGDSKGESGGPPSLEKADSSQITQKCASCGLSLFCSPTTEEETARHSFSGHSPLGPGHKDPSRSLKTGTSMKICIWQKSKANNTCGPQRPFPQVHQEGDQRVTLVSTCHSGACHQEKAFDSQETCAGSLALL